jgi:radical SAM-linked protein
VKLRIRYAKQGKVRFVGNLDVTRIFERALRKAALPVAYSTGFSPRPRLSFGLALPMAAESVAEYVDIELAAEVDADEAARRLEDTFPPGFRVLAVAEKQPGQVSLQEDVVACDWELTLTGVSRAEAVAAVASALSAPVLMLERERKGERRVDDVRPSIEALEVVAGPDDDADEVIVVRARLATTGRGLRPAELAMVVFGPNTDEGVECVRGVLRTEQWIERDGARRELLPLPAAVGAPAGEVGA